MLVCPHPRKRRIQELECAHVGILIRKLYILPNLTNCFNIVCKLFGYMAAQISFSVARELGRPAAD